MIYASTSASIQTKEKQMPDYVVTHYYIDVNNGETLKQYDGTFTDYAAARAAADALLVDAQAATDAHLYRETLAETTDVAGAPAGGSNVFERMSATVDLSGGKRGNIALPAPVAAMFSGNSLDPTAAEWTDFIANFSSDWTISDGENVNGTVRGKRIYVRSGSTNLPA
jgi:hypothetical protein